jgi:uncharacterized protein YxeA
MLLFLSSFKHGMCYLTSVLIVLFFFYKEKYDKLATYIKIKTRFQK